MFFWWLRPAVCENTSQFQNETQGYLLYNSAVLVVTDTSIISEQERIYYKKFVGLELLSSLAFGSAMILEVVREFSIWILTCPKED